MHVLRAFARPHHALFSVLVHDPRPSGVSDYGKSCSVFVHPLRAPIRSPNRQTKMVHEDARRMTGHIGLHALFMWLISLLKS